MNGILTTCPLHVVPRWYNVGFLCVNEGYRNLDTLKMYMCCYTLFFTSNVLYIGINPSSLIEGKIY